MTRLRRIIDTAAAELAHTVLQRLEATSTARGREWLDALRAEADVIEGGVAQLAWALGGVRLAWELQGRKPVIPLIRVLTVVLVGGLLAFGATAAVNVAHEPDTQCAQAPTPPASPPVSQPARLATPADFLALGDYDYDRGACADAIADYTRAIDLDPHFAAAYNNRAYTAMRQQDYATALADLDRAIELRPEYARALMNRGDIYNYYYRIDRQRAMADYDRVVAIGATRGNGSVCGHRLLAYYNGWSPGVVLNIITRGVDGGCTVGTQ